MPEEILETPQPRPEDGRPLDGTDWTRVILAAVLGFGLLTTAAYAGYYYGAQQIQPIKEPTPVVSQPTPKPTPTPEPTTPVVEDETKDWKTHSKYFDYLGFTLKLKYPENWSVEESGHSGHPNFLTLFSPTKESCIRISVSSEGGDKSLDEVLKAGATNWAMTKEDHTVISSSRLTINELAAKIRDVEREGRRFEDGVVSLAPDNRYPTNRVFSYLSSCSMTESDEFGLVVKSFTVE